MIRPVRDSLLIDLRVEGIPLIRQFFLMLSQPRDILLCPIDRIICRRLLEFILCFQIGETLCLKTVSQCHLASGLIRKLIIAFAASGCGHLSVIAQPIEAADAPESNMSLT